MDVRKPAMLLAALPSHSRKPHHGHRLQSLLCHPTSRCLSFAHCQWGRRRSGRPHPKNHKKDSYLSSSHNKKSTI